MRQVRALRVPAVVELLDAVLLNQHPLVAAVLQRLDERVGDVWMIWQRHLGRLNASSKPPDMDLPGVHLHALSGDRQGTWSVKVTGLEAASQNGPLIALPSPHRSDSTVIVPAQDRGSP